MKFLQHSNQPRWTNDIQSAQAKESLYYWAGVAILNQFVKMRLAMDIQWSGMFPNGPKIFASNHPTTTDPFYMLAVIPEKLHIMVNSDIFSKPILGKLMKHSGHIPVDRKSGREAFENAKQKLDEGKNIGIFSEGALSSLAQGLSVNPLKTGTARLSLCTGAPVIPIGIHLPVNGIDFKWLKVGKEMVEARFYLKGRYSITIGKPIWFSGNSDNKNLVNSVGEKIRQEILNLCSLSEMRSSRPLQRARSLMLKTKKAKTKRT